MKKKQTCSLTQEIDVCDECGVLVIPSLDLPESDPSYRYRGIVDGEKAYHWTWLESRKCDAG